MSRHVSQPALLGNLTTRTTRELRALTAELQTRLNDAVRTQFRGLVATLDIVRSENAAAEGGRDRELWQRVESAVAEARQRWEQRVVAVVAGDDDEDDDDDDEEEEEDGDDLDLDLNLHLDDEDD